MMLVGSFNEKKERGKEGRKRRKKEKEDKEKERGLLFPSSLKPLSTQQSAVPLSFSVPFTLLKLTPLFCT
eukprot:scaffold53093_cov52-Cyclotella_meneghiniana.AAC.1